MPFQRSSFCGGGNCVEVADLGKGEVLVRRSDSESSMHFTAQEWDAFIRGVKNGEFDFEEK